jgi:hypothetical protein
MKVEFTKFICIPDFQCLNILIIHMYCWVEFNFRIRLHLLIPIIILSFPLSFLLFLRLFLWLIIHCRSCVLSNFTAWPITHLLRPLIYNHHFAWASELCFHLRYYCVNTFIYYSFTWSFFLFNWRKLNFLFLWDSMILNFWFLGSIISFLIRSVNNGFLIESLFEELD